MLFSIQRGFFSFLLKYLKPEYYILWAVKFYNIFNSKVYLIITSKEIMFKQFWVIFFSLLFFLLKIVSGTAKNFFWQWMTCPLWVLHFNQKIIKYDTLSQICFCCICMIYLFLHSKCAKVYVLPFCACFVCVFVLCSFELHISRG